jgi:threonine aldolase
VRKSIGGGMRQIGILVNAAKSALAENFPERLVATHVKAKYIEVNNIPHYPKAHH